MDAAASERWARPLLFPVHDMPPGVGLDDGDAGRVRLPEALPLTAGSLWSDGVFLLDDGVDSYLWAGRGADPAVLASLFGASSLEGADSSRIRLIAGGNDLASRLDAVVRALREDGSSDPAVLA